MSNRLFAGQKPQHGQYEDSLAQERQVFENCLNVHNLPEIFHYWSRKHVRPKLLPYGFDSPNALFEKQLEDRCGAGRAPQRFVSLGSGNCDVELRVALHLRARGYEGFILDCVDLNPTMLARGRDAAERAGITGNLQFIQSDLNTWRPGESYDAILANQSLHHVINLEGLFEQVKQCLKDDGQFVISDMIGRNGHQRWPEALELVHEFWRRLPPSYRFNRRNGCYEELFQDWDCSVEGFEGVRSQDILPLLFDYFHFRFFLPFGNAIDPFVDRSFGYHFNATASWDRDFVDELHQRDDAAIATGTLTPTHMLAVVGNGCIVHPVFPENLSPEFCVRIPDERRQQRHSPINQSPYHWWVWPQDPIHELEVVCGKLGEAQALALSLEKELNERTAWALALEQRLEERTLWARILEKENGERTAWAHRLEKELAERTAWALDLSRELDKAEQTGFWALKLRDELEEKVREVRRLEEELYAYLHNPLRFAARLGLGVWRRVKRLLIEMRLSRRKGYSSAKPNS